MFKQTPFKIAHIKPAESKASNFSKIAVALTMGALSLTACGAPATGAAAPSAASQAARPAAASTSSAATAPQAGATASALKPVAGRASAAADSGVKAAPPAAAPASPAAPAPIAPVAPAAGETQAAAVKGSTPAVAPIAAQAAVAATGDGSQAATARGWGAVVAGDEFSNTGAPDSTKWSVFKGSGHAGKGVRSPQAWSVAGGVATVSGNSAGTTGGMSAKFAQQKYGKWETRMRTNARDPKYHPVLILWPNNNTSPNCAEIDYAEGSTNTAQIKFFLHYACSGSNFQTTAAKTIDTTQWHNYAVEWTPAGITGYIDGVKTFSDTNPSHLPSVGMHQTLQLDWFPDGSATKPSQMQVDWVRVYK